ncbi:hypothetical protein D9615_007396 [Tricholomella constricta]|uniref:Uncharacterized protein n=1 Tax=Tricholomella constricta TaxID=117010 RepID=A0A8H5GYR4_9AGAR|nr:hypothetical protein D9615_007396 [Tricholomella constricta]
MGRALFSTRYQPKVAVRTEPEPVPPCEKWSITNPFDPESDEFNRDAQREVFIDTEAYRHEQEAIRALVAEGGTEASDSSDSSDSDRGSPMAVGSDDPALLIADAYPNVDWESRWLAAGASSDWIARRGSAAADDQTRPIPVNRSRSATVSSGPVFIPSSPRYSPESDTGSPTARRTVNITPISIPNEPSTSSPLSPPSPVTPTDNIYAREMQSLLTPSPPPSVTPHVYTWHRLALAVPTSPLASQSAPVGPLTNPNARMSLARINIAPVRVRIQNAV